MKSVNYTKPGYTSITCSKTSNIPYDLFFTTIFNDSSILITIISCEYLNLSLANEYVGDVTIPTQVFKYNQNVLQADQPIRFSVILGHGFSNPYRTYYLLRRIPLSLHVRLPIAYCESFTLHTFPICLRYHRVCNKSNILGTAFGTGTPYIPEHLGSSTFFSGVRIARS